MTVAASDIRDRFAGFSNWGRCVDIIAPVSSTNYCKMLSANITSCISDNVP